MAQSIVGPTGSPSSIAITVALKQLNLLSPTRQPLSTPDRAVPFSKPHHAVHTGPAHRARGLGRLSLHSITKQPRLASTCTGLLQCRGQTCRGSEKSGQRLDSSGLQRRVSDSASSPHTSTITFAWTRRLSCRNRPRNSSQSSPSLSQCRSRCANPP